MFTDSDRATVAKLAARCLAEELHKTRPFGVKAGGLCIQGWDAGRYGATTNRNDKQGREAMRTLASAVIVVGAVAFLSYGYHALTYWLNMPVFVG